MVQLHSKVSRRSTRFFYISRVTSLWYGIFILIVEAFHNVSTLTTISNHHIKSNSAWIGPLVSSNTTGNYFEVSITITLTQENCCPIFVFLTEAVESTLIKDGCYNISKQMHTFLLHAAISMEKHHQIYIDPTYCQNTPTGFTSCHKNLIANLYTVRNASLYAYYPCYARKNMDFTVSITIRTDTKHHGCQPLKPNLPCYEFYKSMYLPNIFGNLDLVEDVSIFTVANVVATDRCHKHLLKIVCRAFYPECTINGVIAPCRSMCYEVMNECSDLATTLLGTLVGHTEERNIMKDFLCKQFPEHAPCYRENVTCEAPAQIQHSENPKVVLRGETYNYNDQSIIPVHSITKYKCIKDYELEGNSTSVCEYSGEWSVPPKCIPMSNNRQTIIVGATFGAFTVFILLIILVVFIFRREIVVILYAKFGVRFNSQKEENRNYDAFIAYSQDDIGFVKYQLLRPLEQMNPKFKICIHHRDFEIGNFISTNIINAIKQSKRTIIVLSQSFITSEWCKFEFEQAHLQLMHDQSYKLIVILLDEPRNLESIPQLMQSYIQTRTYLMRTDKLFWKKLLYQMPDKKATSEERCEMI